MKIQAIITGATGMVAKAFCTSACTILTWSQFCPSAGGAAGCAMKS